jgi:hypothetical protein
MVLLDIARAACRQLCARNRIPRLSRPSGPLVYDGRPASLGDVRRHVDRLRRSLYLDEPNDVDWVFRNEILDRRESRSIVNASILGGASRM